MKPETSLRSFLALAGSALLLVSQSQAAYYYWDTNSTTAGLGDTAGTWGTNGFMHSVTNAEARGLVTGILPTSAPVTLVADTITFGTINLSLGSTGSAVAVTGTQSIGTIIFGLGQTHPVTLTGGTIAMGAAGSIIAHNTSNTISSVLGGAATSLTKNGPGTVHLTGANIYTGATIISGGGTLTVGNGTTGRLNGTTGTALTFNNGGGFLNVAEAASSTQGMGALTFSAGHGSVTSTTAGVSPATASLTFGSLATRAAGATGNFSLATNTTASENKIVLTDTTNAPLDSDSNNSGLFFGGAEYARYDTTNGCFRAVTYGTDINSVAPLSGTDVGSVTSATDVKLNGNVTAQTNAAVNTIHLNGNSLSLQDGDQILDVNGILSNGGSIAAVGALRGTSSGGEIVFNVTGGNLSVAPIIQDSRLTKTGAGTLTLSGANTYVGSTVINSGTLAVSGGVAIEDTGAVVLANAAGVTFKLNADETIGNLSGGGFSGGLVDVQGNTLTFGDSGNQTFGGTFTGLAGGAIIKQGSGTLTLSNVNTFPGTLTINGGTLTFTLGNSGTTSAQTLSSGGAINMAGTTTMSFAPAAQVALGQFPNNTPSNLASPNGWVIDNAIKITSGSASFRFAGNGSKWNFTGGVTGGTSDSQALNILQGTPAGGGGDAQDILFSGVIQDGGGILGVSVDFTASSGLPQNALVNLSGQNTFTGPIAVANTRGLTSGAYLTIGGERTSNHATLGLIPGSGSLGTTSPGSGNYSNTISLASGTILNYASSANQTLAGEISGLGQILKHGAGTLTLTGNNTYSGATSHTLITTATTIRAGTLSVGSLNSVVGGSPSSNLGAPSTVTNGTIAIGVTSTAAQLTYTGTSETTDRVIDLAGSTGGAILDQSGASGLLKFTSNFTATGAGIKTLTLQGSMSGSGEVAGAIVDNTLTNKTSVIKSGSGTWTLSGANTYSGATTVSAGTLLIHNTTGSGTGAGNVSVTAGTLGGNGTITGTVTIGNGTGSADAILAPGNSIDSIDTGNLTFNSDGSYAVELNGSSVTSDVANVTGTVTMDALTTLTVSVAGTLAASQQYVIVSNNAADPVIGTFAGLAQDAVVGNFGGIELKISYTGVDGNDIVLYTVASGSPYSTWAGTAVFTDDANRDGVDNGMAWVLGATDKDSIALGLLPTLDNTSDPNYFIFTYRRKDDANNDVTNTTIAAQYSNSLTGWTTAVHDGSDIIITPTNDFYGSSPGIDKVEVKIKKTLAGSGGMLFARLSATGN